MDLRKKRNGLQKFAELVIRLRWPLLLLLALPAYGYLFPDMNSIIQFFSRSEFILQLLAPASESDLLKTLLKVPAPGAQTLVFSLMATSCLLFMGIRWTFSGFYSLIFLVVGLCFSIGMKTLMLEFNELRILIVLTMGILFLLPYLFKKTLFLRCLLPIAVLGIVVLAAGFEVISRLSGSSLLAEAAFHLFAATVLSGFGLFAWEVSSSIVVGKPKMAAVAKALQEQAKSESLALLVMLLALASLLKEGTGVPESFFTTLLGLCTVYLFSLLLIFPGFISLFPIKRS
jgi:hypothetical protein